MLSSMAASWTLCFFLSFSFLLSSCLVSSEKADKSKGKDLLLMEVHFLADQPFSSQKGKDDKIKLDSWNVCQAKTSLSWGWNF